MPLIPADIKDIKFSQKDLFLDVKLETITINQKNALDFTGRPTFNVGFFRNSAGFGITSIKISTNASLQPTVDIEFKDLYGKTVFAESAQEGIDYKALFQWPPPKFKFTFKGYLGQPVTWMLNMKTTSTQFNSDDGSYTIRATFIPNQWGMFADMPFLYLFAVKKLKADRLNKDINPSSSKEELDKFQKDTESIIDLMYVGKKIEVVKKKKTKSLQKTIDSLTLLKRDPITGIIGGTFKSGDEITEITPENNDKIDGFKAITIALPSEYESLSEGEVKDKIRSISANLRVVENIRIKLAILKGLGNDAAGKALKNFNTTGADENTINNKKDAAKALDGIIDENLRLIDELIKFKIYDENELELKKLTIKEVFSRIAGDAAYILGYMLDAGEQGYYNNQTKRDEDEKKAKIIGRYFPMKWKTEEKGNEKINTQIPAKIDYGIENFELKFVNEFIVAISEGIAQNRALQAQNFDNDEDKIKHRVSNMEILSSNPFRNIIDWKEIASIIMKRAGIAGYVTQSSLVNAPGDYDSTITRTRNNNTNQMLKMASSDVVNLDDSILSKLQTEDLENLKEFCLFWMNLIDDPSGTTHKGQEFGADISWKGGNSTAQGSEINKIVIVTAKGNSSSIAKTSSASKNLIELVNRSEFSEEQEESLKEKLNAKVNKDNNTFERDVELLDAGFKAYTVEEYLSQFIGPRYIFFGRSTNQAKAGLKYSEPTLQSTFNFYDTLSYITNFNNLTFIHHPNVEDDYYEFLVFEDAQDIQKLKEFQPGSNEGDSELTKSGSDEDEEDDEEEDDLFRPQSILFFDDTKFIEDPTDPSDKSDTPQFEWWKKNYGQQSFLASAIDAVANASGPGDKTNKDSFISYNWCKSRLNLDSAISGITKISTIKDIGGNIIKQVDRTRLTRGYDFKAFLTNTGPAETTDISELRTINVTKKPIAIIPYAQNWNSSIAFVFDANKPCPTGGFFGESALAIATRVFLREYCKSLYTNIESLQDETSKIFGQILGKAGEHEDLLYQQMHNLFHQWQILALDDNNERINEDSVGKPLTPKVAVSLEEKFSKSEDTNFENSENKLEENNPGDYSSGFIYSYPLQSRGKENDKFIQISESLINIEPLYNAKANTTVLNVLQQLCSKNNFMFFPIAGNSGFLNIENLFEPSFNINAARISNSFQILFHPTPESRVLVGDNEPIDSKFKDNIEDFSVNAFPIAFGDPTNKIVKSVVVGTDDNKVTAESIVNLQRIVDNENNNRTVTTDCSLLSVFEGRSYKAKLSTLGNAQISPMQFFFLKNHTIFTGLYQIMKVDHNITPNDMTTEFEGIKMRYASGGYGGVLPITLDDYRKAANIIKNAPNESQETEGELGEDIAIEGGTSTPEDGSIPDGTIGSGVSLVDDSEIEKNRDLSVGRLSQSTTEIKIPSTVSSYFIDTSRLKTTDNLKPLPNENETSRGVIKKSTLIKHINEFIADRLEGFSEFLNTYYPQWKGRISITSAIRSSIVDGSSSGSQHLRGEAIDIGFGGSVGEKLNNTHDLFNALMQFHRINNYEWDQILIETRDSTSVWIHWSYSRGHRIGIYQNIVRFYNNKTKSGVPVNNNRDKKSVSSAAQTYTKSQTRMFDMAGNKT
jgi:hypothetical protein